MNLPANAPSCFGPGLTFDLSYETYAAGPGVRASHLKNLDVSPAHYQWALKNKTTSKAWTLGTAGHCATLEPDRFKTDFAAWGEKTESGRARPRNGKDWDAFRDSMQDRTILTADEHATATAIAQAVRSHPAAMRYLGAGQPEVSMMWDDYGHTLQARPDWLTTIDGVDCLVGLKTARDCRMRQFGAQAAQLGYVAAWAMYHDGFVAITNRKPHVVEIVVESGGPRSVSVYHITEEILARGREEYTRLLAVFDTCKAAGHWPGPVDGEVDLVLPPWAYGDALEMTITDAEEE